LETSLERHIERRRQIDGRFFAARDAAQDVSPHWACQRAEDVVEVVGS
jgi:hypothetical protein